MNKSSPKSWDNNFLKYLKLNFHEQYYIKTIFQILLEKLTIENINAKTSFQKYYLDDTFKILILNKKHANFTSHIKYMLNTDYLYYLTKDKIYKILKIFIKRNKINLNHLTIVNEIII
tara:strand:- start:4660 stop:5013 length:354 start_codon:yes stop_codon:yes gene_type:complete